MADLYISEETADDIETAAVDAALDGRFVVVRESERLIRAVMVIAAIVLAGRLLGLYG